MIERRAGAAERDEERDWITGLASGKTARLRLGGADRPNAVLLIGLAGFRNVNVAHGREGGDRALASVGERIRRMLRAGEGAVPFAARTGGAEFLVLLDLPGAAQCAQLLARQLVAELNRPVEIDGGEIHLSPRIGIAEAHAGEGQAAFMRRARMALEEAMRADTRTIVQSEAGRLDEALMDETLGRHLRHAFERREIAILFQPQFALADGRMTGAEALARWRHPEFGTLGGEALFAAAARSDFVAPLSRHIQERAIALAADWTGARDDVRLSINVTAQDLASPDMADRLLGYVAGSGFRSDCLTVEITESALIADLDAAAKQFERLRGEGLKIALDDFGTGYSSLSYLSALPLDYLKLDKRLTEDLQGSERDRIVVRAVIAMAKALGLEVIAEGIESEAQRLLIEREGCDYWQGFLRAGALEPDAFRDFALKAD
ncbi:putative bifunctional diguanylate cyclase/phosphodiesterase [Novosphingopyxis sp.]|uniref:putative bifunctional diguanylate cyclase/phosphodiesterase n=1 Tax=Novosphingopyxis sp. TaxID=2709690 RepID=UPI003B5C991E